eukprot:1507314-Rhodomonas_salina.1
MHRIDSQTLEFTDKEEQEWMQELQRERNEDNWSQAATQPARAASGESVTGESVTDKNVTGESTTGESVTGEFRRVTRSQAKSNPSLPPASTTDVPAARAGQPESAPQFETSSNCRRPQTWTHCSHVLLTAKIAELSDTHPGKALAHHHFQMELAPEWQSDDLYEGDNARFPRETITMVAREWKLHKGVRCGTST